MAVIFKRVTAWTTNYEVQQTLRSMDAAATRSSFVRRGHQFHDAPKICVEECIVLWQSGVPIGSAEAERFEIVFVSILMYKWLSLIGLGASAMSGRDIVNQSNYAITIPKRNTFESHCCAHSTRLPRCE